MNMDKKLYKYRFTLRDDSNGAISYREETWETDDAPERFLQHAHVVEILEDLSEKEVKVVEEEPKAVEEETIVEVKSKTKKK